MGDPLERINYCRCVWCRQTCHSATRMQRHVEDRCLIGKCDPMLLRSPLEVDLPDMAPAEYRERRRAKMAPSLAG